MFEDTRRAKRARTTRLVLFVPRYVFLFVSIMFLCTNWWFYIYTGSIYGSKAHEGIGWATIGKMGTNDASGVVCAQLCVFFFFCAFCILTNVYRCYIHFEGMRKHRVGDDRQNRPKQRAWRVVWALDMCFFHMFLCILLIFIYIYRSYLHTKDMRMVWMGNKGQNRPKQRVGHIIWVLGMYFPSFSFIFSAY